MNKIAAIAHLIKVYDKKLRRVMCCKVRNEHHEFLLWSCIYVGLHLFASQHTREWLG
jgi:hypothetical protein